MARIDNINLYSRKKEAVVPDPLPESAPANNHPVPEVAPKTDTPTPDVSQTASPKYGLIENPVSATPASVAGSQVNDNSPITYQNSGIAPTMTSSKDYRSGAIQTMDEGEFERNKKQMNASDKEYWTEQFKMHPESSYVTLQNMMASDETPEEKRKRERREQLGQVFSNLGNVIGNAAGLYYATKGGLPIDLNTSANMENERMRRIKEKRDALKERQDAILMNAKLGDIAADRNNALAMRKLANDELELKAKLKGQATDDALKSAKLEYQRLLNDGVPEKQAAELAYKKAQIGAQNAAAYSNYQRGKASEQAARDKSMGKGKREIAYITKYGDVSFDNPKNKKAATLSTLEVMKNGAPDEERKVINELLYNAVNGDTDSYNKAEMYVSQHLNNDAVALKHLYEQAKKYGSITGDDRQTKSRDTARGKGGWTLNSKKSTTGWSLK